MEFVGSLNAELIVFDWELLAKLKMFYIQLVREFASTINQAFCD